MTIDPSFAVSGADWQIQPVESTSPAGDSTSDFGSMREIGAPGGALLVDPRDDHAIARALATLLTDDLEHARLSREAAARPARTWDDYAAETWSFLVADEATERPRE